MTVFLYSTILPRLPFRRRVPVSFFSASLPSLSVRQKTYSHLLQEITSQQAAEAGKQAHAHMITSGFNPTIFVYNCLISMYIKTSNLAYACQVFNRMPERDLISWNTLLAGYAQSGLMDVANAVFQSMSDRDVISWNSMIAGYLHNGDCWVSIDLFSQMRQAGIEPDRISFAIIFKACASLDGIVWGICVHCLSLKMGFGSDVFSGSALVDMYAKCRELGAAYQVFHEMPEKNWVSWSAMIAGYAQNDQSWHGLELFIEMQRAGVGVSQSTYASIFRCCACARALQSGSAAHGHALKANFDLDVVVGTSIIDMYAKCGRLDYARQVFVLLPEHTLQSWNSIIIGHVRNSQAFEALRLFSKMQSSIIGVDEITLSGVLSACAGAGCLSQGLQVHALVVKTRYQSDICVANALLDMYAKCGFINAACDVFNRMERKDSVSWNAIVSAHEQNGLHYKTLLYFNEMRRWSMEPDEFTYGSVMKSCATLSSLNLGMEIHSCIVKSALGSDLFVCGALIDMYCKCGSVKDAHIIHERIGKQSLVSWNAIVSGFSQQKQSEEALTFFYKMLEAGLKPDHFTYATVLDACANLASISLGRQIHCQIIKEDLRGDLFISSTLVDMYSKCGCMHDSLQMFRKMSNKDHVSWNAMINGYAQHGLGAEALAIFKLMQQEKVQPNHATFVAVLRACAYVGLFDDGAHYFQLMSNQYGLNPQIEHYACMVDIYGRSGKICDAMALIKKMPFEADAVIWRTLLCACRDCANVEVAEIAAKSILKLDPYDSAIYILLSNVYAEAGMWMEVSNMRQMMKQNRLKKEPGCSWIEVRNQLHAFLVGDHAHPRSEDIYKMLNCLISDMKFVGYIPCDIDTYDEEENL
ncbi:Pentatricopeptide repeat-containing protein [Nymphaea thermarum]|nr:Pentatricopeptide repeat-containing protein [Nymphaea thermarum]